ncbi:MAG: carbohydrate-binding family 9-like protein [Clostridia bacterium]|nr:carbohydrate-binding family 9-like protein [Clostridia bacterium]
MLTVPKIETLADFFDTYLEIPVSCINWEGYAPAPTVKVNLAYVDGKGLAVRLLSSETDLIARVNTPDGMVCLDSCLEAFIDFAPESGKGYLNFEINPFAALHEGFGTGRHGRVFPRQNGVPPTDPITSVSSEGWEAMFIVTLPHIEAIYGKSELKSGDVIKANFYCCADEKPTGQYYASAFPINTPQPDYHRPEFFAELTIG